MHIFTYTYLCRDVSAAVQRCVEVECPTRQVIQEDTACVYHHVCTHIHVLTLFASPALAPCDSSFATVPARPFSLATCNAERL